MHHDTDCIPKQSWRCIPIEATTHGETSHHNRRSCDSGIASDYCAISNVLSGHSNIDPHLRRVWLDGSRGLLLKHGVVIHLHRQGSCSLLLQSR